MFPARTILCPTDFFEPAEAAVRTAEAIARESGARLILLHVVEMPPRVEPGGVLMHPAEFDYQLEREQLDAITIDPAVDLERVFVLGAVPEDILSIAEERKCDLIVIGTHGRTGLGRLLMGSVAESVIRKAPCPVLSVRTASCPVARTAEMVGTTG
jgi:nucleotide-binding universal stress UspA family protein